MCCHRIVSRTQEFANLSGAKSDTAQAETFCQAFREIAMLMLARHNYSLPDGKCVGRTSVRCKAEATGAKLSEGRSTQLQPFQMNGEPDWRSSLALLRAVYQIGSQAAWPKPAEHVGWTPAVSLGVAFLEQQ